MEFNITAQRIPLNFEIQCMAKLHCTEKADFYIGDVAACRVHIWLVLMHEYRKASGVDCLRCIPTCDRATSANR